MKIVKGLIAIVIALFGNAHAKQVLKVGLIEGERPPYFWHDQQLQPHGIYFDLLKLVEQRIGVQFEYHYLPQSRIRKMMVMDSLDLEPGIDSSWRLQKGEAENSVYSRVFIASPEAWIFSNFKQQDVSRRIASNKLKACNIHGFNLAEEQLSAEKAVAPLTDKGVLLLLKNGRCDFSLMPVHVFDYYNSRRVFKLERSEVVKTYQLRLRLHKKHQGLIPDIDRALRAIETSGQLRKIYQSYGVE